jgi:hypothetical protein
MIPFSVKAYLTKPEFVSLSVRRTLASPIILFFTVIGLVGMILGLLEVLHLIRPVISVYPTLFMGFYFAIAFPAFNALLAARNYKYGVLSSREITYTFSEEGLSLQGDGIESTLLFWQGIVRKQRVGKHLLLFTDRVSAFILPMDGLSEGQLDFIRSKVPVGRL